MAKTRQDRAKSALEDKVGWALEGLGTYQDAAEVFGYSSRETTRTLARRGTLLTVKTPSGPLVAVEAFWRPVELKDLSWGRDRDTVRAKAEHDCGRIVTLTEGEETKCECGERFRMKVFIEVQEQPR